ncbi:hypothetical protein HanOQP8_Chr09g0334851 [Helianthus annuus]|nr:hypothetical protein HanOQP8_Chr09g0334851 [Helianthus annuus]KAJ0894319.1 hypothetical protein HanPSC8_Chr09g0387721 [Helianthus annuus]
MPLRKKPTLYPIRNPHAITDDYQWTFLFIIMMPNTIGAITRSIRQNNYLLAFLCISVCVCLFLLQFCLSKYLSLPKNEKSSRKLWLKLNMWLLYTAICFGLVYQFADFFPLQMTVTLYGVLLMLSSIGRFGVVVRMKICCLMMISIVVFKSVFLVFFFYHNTASQQVTNLYCFISK